MFFQVPFYQQDVSHISEHYNNTCKLCIISSSIHIHELMLLHMNRLMKLGTVNLHCVWCIMYPNEDGLLQYVKI